jgi:hypothetical protein
LNVAQGAALDRAGGGATVANNVFAGNYTGSGQATMLICSALLIGNGGATTTSR